MSNVEIKFSKSCSVCIPQGIMCVDSNIGTGRIMFTSHEKIRVRPSQFVDQTIEQCPIRKEVTEQALEDLKRAQEMYRKPKPAV